MEEVSRMDPELDKVRQILRSGWPQHQITMDPDIQKYFDSINEIAVLDGIVFKGDKVVILTYMRSDMYAETNP